LLQDDSNGQGPYIKEWNISGLAKPTDEQLNAVDSAADLSERQAAVRATRRNAYGDLGSQLDMQYHDSIDGTTTWKDHVASVSQLNKEKTNWLTLEKLLKQERIKYWMTYQGHSLDQLQDRLT
jgi:hypothetical protein